ncbi:ISMsm3 C transposase [Streptomyces sp. 769]|nr:ISMsm3 C transposase [Streptomyces sp. 769]
MKKRIGSYLRVRIEVGGRGVVSQAGDLPLTETAHKTGPDQSLSTAPGPWRKAHAVHDPGRTALDLALVVPPGGDCLADVAMLRAEPEMFGPVASDPTVHRLIDILAINGNRALTAIGRRAASSSPFAIREGGT